MWFLDDGLLRGKSKVVLDAMTLMSSELSKINLQVNSQKCEIYSHGSADELAGLGSIPVVRERDAWSYLGTPLFEQTSQALEPACKGKPPARFRTLQHHTQSRHSTCCAPLRGPAKLNTFSKRLLARR